jgi:hypothetical protein
MAKNEVNVIDSEILEAKIKLREQISKRVTGIILLSISVIMRSILFYRALGSVVADPGTATDVASGLAVAGLTLLIGDAAQQIFKKGE